MVFVACGVVAGVTLPGVPSVAAVLFGAALVFRAAVRRPRPHRRVAWAAGLFAAGALLGALRAGVDDAGGREFALPLPAASSVVAGEGVVVRAFSAPPGAAVPSWVDVVLFKEGPPRAVRVKIWPAEGGAPDVPLPHAWVRVSGRFHPPASPRNPWEWDEQAHFQRLGLDGQLVVEDGQRIETLRPPPWHSTAAWAARARRWVARTLSQGIADPDARAVVLGVTLGQREGLSQEALLAFRRTGSLHLFAVSGLHIGLLAGTVLGTVSLVGGSRRQGVWLALPAVWLQAVVTGAEPPALRAAFVLSLFLVGLVLDKRSRPLNTLGAAAGILLLTQPSQLGDLSFQLTMSVALGIVVVGIPLARWLSRPARRDPFLPAEFDPPAASTLRRGYRTGAGIAACGVAAHLGALPFAITHFNLITPASVLLGFFLLPAAWGILVLSLAALLLAAICPAGWVAGFNQAAACLAALALALCSWTQNLPGAWWMPPRPLDGSHEMLVFDLDRGASAAVVRSRSAAWLVDSGNPAHARRILRPAMSRLGAAPPKRVLLTHRDAQHRGGLPVLTGLFGPAEMVLTGPDTSVHPEASSLAADVLFPPPGWSAPRADDRASILRFRLGNARVLWVGDAGFAPQKWILDEGDTSKLPCHVLCLGWHATDLGLAGEFVRRAAPRLLILHRARPETLYPPTSATRDHWEAQGIAVFDQEATGAVKLVIQDGEIIAHPFLDPQHPVRIPLR